MNNPKKRTKEHLLLEELGCPHRWGYGVTGSGSAMSTMYCMDCMKQRVQNATVAIWDDTSYDNSK